MLDDCSIIVPTYHPGEIINNLLNSLPEVKEIIILDNSDDINLKNLIIDRFKNIKYNEEVNFIKLNIFPDGGVSRLRIFGKFN